MCSRISILLWCFCLFLAGCGEKLDIADVTGTVRLKGGQPLELVHVEFWSDNGIRSFGKTDESGNFKLVLDDRSADGAMIGSHKILLRDTWPMKDNYIGEGGDWVDKSDGKKSRISSKYYDVSSTPLSLQVKAGEKNHFDIEADARGK